MAARAVDLADRKRVLAASWRPLDLSVRWARWPRHLQDDVAASNRPRADGKQEFAQLHDLAFVQGFALVVDLC